MSFKNCGKEIGEKICSSPNNKKVDEGFEFNYWNLSYKRKFIRTLFILPVGIIVLIPYLIYGGNENHIKILFITIFFILWAVQLIYNYYKWKAE